MNLQRASFMIAGAVALASLFFVLAWLGTRRFTTGQPLVWDFRTSRDPSVIGWIPTGPSDTGFELKGNYDFTLIVPEGNTFHQTVWAIGCATNKGKIAHVYAHFGKNVKVSDAVALAQEIIQKWNKGIEIPLILGGDPPPDQWLKRIAAGDTFYSRYSMTTGGIRVSVNMVGSEGPKAGLNRTCNLTLEIDLPREPK